MGNLRLIDSKVNSSTEIVFEFTENLSKTISASNFYLRPVIESVPVPTIEEVSIIDNIVFLTTDYLTPYAKYEVVLKSTEQNPFVGANGDLLLFSTSDKKYILGFEDSSEPIRSNFIRYLQNNIYSLESGTLIRDIINADSKSKSQILFDIKELSNDIFLDRIIYNELKIRGIGPFDRLNEGGVFEILKVSKNLNSNLKSYSKQIDEFPSIPISLQAVSHSETLLPGITVKTFDKLLLRLSKFPVSKLVSLTIIYGDSTVYEFPIQTISYQLKNSRYDELSASYLLLEDNEILLGEDLLKYTKLPGAGDSIQIEYEYLNLGRSIDEASVEVYQNLQSIRESAPPITTYFTLKYSPILDVNSNVPELSGVSFLDPEASPPFSTIHPAFLTEKRFDLNSLPQAPGEYAVEYSTGKIFVYGAIDGDGTGNSPPACTYRYKNSFSDQLDFIYDSETKELVSSPVRNLTGEVATIAFLFEDLFVPGTDYNEQIHQEVINERVNNKVTSTGSLLTVNSPITNVFRLLNETTGEVYSIQRWNDYSVFFSSKTPPMVKKIQGEKVNFSTSINETLFVSEEIDYSSKKIFKIQLLNAFVVGSTNDCIGSSFNTSVSFSDKTIFESEIYHDEQDSLEENYDRLSIGKYFIDYIGGIVYVQVEDLTYDIGSINYSYGLILTENKHIIAVDDLYFYFGTVEGINKKVKVNSFTDIQIEPNSLELSNERFLNGDTTLNYVIESDSFSTTDDGVLVRGLYDLYDLKNNDPTNFADGATISTNTVSLQPITKTTTCSVSGFTVDVPFISDGIEITEIISVLDSSNNELWNEFGSFSNYTITLDSSNSGTVSVTYKVKLNGAATIVIDYSRGNLLIDYTYLMDELVISYEYGNNLLDFRETSKAITPGDQYYVTYKVGALRNALLNNFGSLFDVPLINHTDLNILRESYRDVLSAAMGSTTKGPTVLALKELVQQITHISPELIEAAFENWSLGASYFYPNQISIVGDIQYLPGRNGDGFYVSETNQFVSLPAVSNFRIEEGTFEAWILPDWKGFDNDAELTFSILKNGTVLPASSIFIGRNNYNPILDLNNKFNLLKKSSFDSTGKPSTMFTNVGVFIYFDEDTDSWKFLAKDSVNETNVYSGKIETSGEFYGVKNIPNLGEINDILRSGKKTIEFELNIDQYDAENPDGYDGYDGYTDGYIEGFSFDGITFKSDLNHYIFDFGKVENKNRLSIFKDGSGYIVFQTFDKFGNRSELSSNIKTWNSGEKHHIATSWKLNTIDGRDEMHLFIDGFEIPNVLKYGNRPLVTTSDKYRSIGSEVVLYSATQPSISASDLTISNDSSFVVSLNTNFEELGIIPGNILRINEPGFEDYTILSVDGFSLELDQTLNTTMADVDYSVNPVDVIVSTQVAIYTNIVLYVISNGIETELPGKRANIPGYEISKNDLGQDVVSIYGNFIAGDKVVLRTLGLNHRRVQENIYLWSDSSVIKTQLPEPISLDEVKITAVPLMPYLIGPNSSTGPGIYIGSTSLTQPTNTTEGRYLSVKINGGNINFSSPVSIIINGTIFGGGTSETLTFSSNGTKSTIGKFTSLSTVQVSVLPIVETKDFLVVEVFEKDPITVSQDNNAYPIIGYSYISQTGTTLSSIGTSTLTDLDADFLDSVVNETLVITSGIGAGSYSIIEWIDQHTIKINSSLSSFTDAEYKIYYSGVGNSAFQNGYFTFLNIQTITPYVLPKGYYKFDYSTYLTIKMDPLTNESVYFGSDMFAKYPSNSVINEIRILSKQLTDVRIGESPVVGQDYISKDYQRKNQFSPNKNTLTLIHGNEPLINSAKFFVSSERDFIQSGNSINAEFDQSIFFDTVPLVIDNNGILNNNAGTIEFWVSPKYDTINDPKTRYYFDACAFSTQEVYSTTKTTIILPERVASIYSATSGLVDYFAGGKLLSDGRTIQLGKPLNFERTLLDIAYLPLGLSGDRLSIYKDASGYIVFELTANQETYQLKSPIIWDRNSWHRVAATYICNSKNSDKLEFFIDGNECGMLTFGTGALFGTGNVFGQSWSGPSSISGDFHFRDSINLIHLGSDFREVNIAQARMDNLRISNIAKSFWTVANQKKDLNYSSNIKNVLPVIEDLYTTYLLNFDSVVFENKDMTIVRDEINGIFNFALNIIDSFGILAGNAKIKDILESLIKLFKPSESKVKINYIK